MEKLKQKLKSIKLVLLDVDGVLTDGGLYYSNSGERTKKFYVKDGTGIKLLQRAGIEVAFITGLQSDLVSHRAGDLGVTEVVQNCMKKDIAGEELVKKKNLTWEQVAFIGDDVIDISLLKKVGVAIAVADAIDEVKEIADFVTNKDGGRGAVREFCDLLLKHKS